jgi:hypothetical protein
MLGVLLVYDAECSPCGATTRPYGRAFERRQWRSSRRIAPLTGAVRLVRLLDPMYGVDLPEDRTCRVLVVDVGWFGASTRC